MDNTKKKLAAAEEKKKQEALARARQQKHSQGARAQVPTVGLTKSFVPVGTQGVPTKKKEVEGDGLGGKVAKKGGGRAAKDPCGGKPRPKIELDMLAVKVYERLLFEARIERERTGWELQ